MPRPSRVLVCGVRSVTHLLHVASWLRHRDPDGVGGSVDVLDPRAFLGAARVGPADLERYLPVPARVVTAPETAGRRDGAGRDELVCVGSPAVRAWAEVAGSARRPPRVVVVDDGLGTYGSWRTRRAAVRREGGSAPVALLRGVARSSSGPLVRARRWPLYLRRGAGWAVHEPVAAEFRRHLGAVDRAAAATAVYLSQPWPELGVLTEREHLDHLGAVRARCADAGLALLVRPHPVEDPARYVGAGLAVLAADRPAEVDPRVAGAGVVLGTLSTALLNVAALHGTPAVRLAPAGLDALGDGLSGAQRSLLATFLGDVVTGEGADLARRLEEVGR